MNISLNGINAAIKKAGARIDVIGLHAGPDTNSDPRIVGLGASVGCQLS